MSLDELAPLLIAAENSLREEISNWQTLENDTWIDGESLNAIVNQLAQDVSSKTESLSSELANLFVNIQDVFQLNQEQFESVSELYDEYKTLISKFDGALEDQHIPEFNFSFDTVEQAMGSAVDGIKEDVESLVAIFESDISERFDAMRSNTISAVEETQQCLEMSLNNIGEKVESVQSVVTEVFDNNREAVEEKQIESNDKTDFLKTQLNEKLDEMFRSLTSEIRGLSDSFEEVERELDSIQQNVQYTMDTASECMKMCGVGMNSGANSLNTVKSCLDGVV